MTNQAHIIANPFEIRSVTYAWQSGETIKQILDNVDPALNKCAVVAVDGHAVKNEYFHVLRPKAGTLITVNVVPGDKDTTRILVTIALAVASWWAGGVAGVAFGKATGVAAGTTTAGMTIVSAAVSTAIFTVGMLAINALLPLDTGPEEGESASQSLAVGASRNRIAPFSVAPMLLGYMRIFPNQASLPYSSYEGQDQIVHMLFYLGYRNMRVYKSTDKLGETDLSSYADVKVEYDTGGTGDTEITTYRRSRVEQSVNVALQMNKNNRITQATVANSISARVDVIFLRGLIYFEDDGDKWPRTVIITIDYRLTGSGDDWTTAEAFTVSAQTQNSLRKSRLIEFPAEDQYDVSMYVSFSDVGGGSNGQLYDGDPFEGGVIFNTPTWTVIRSFRSGVPVNNPNAALAGLRIKATDQLNGTPDIFNVEAQSKAPDWDASAGAWKQVGTGTNNPAALLRKLVLTDSTINARALGLVRLDDTSFQTFWTWCDDMDFKFNMYIDYQATVNDVINMVAASGRALCYNVDGLWQVKIDKKQTLPHQYFSPRTTQGYAATRIYPEDVHGFRVRFISEVEGWENSEMIVYKDGYSADGAGGTLVGSKFEALQLPGVTNPDQVWLLTRCWLNVAEIQRENFSITTDVENLVSLRGDRVAWQEDSLLIGLGSSRVKSFSDPALVLDSEVEFDNTEANGFYGFTVRLSDGTSVTFTADTNGETSPNNTFTVNGSPSFAADDLALFGEVGSITQDLIIRDITPGVDMSAILTCLPYSDSLYPEENGDVAPTYDPVITADPTKGVPVIGTITSDESVDGMRVEVSSSGDTDRVEWLRFEYRLSLVDETTNLPTGAESDTPWTLVLLSPDTSSYEIADAIDNRYYDVRLSYAYDDGTIGGFTETQHIVAKTSIMPGVININPASIEVTPGTFDVSGAVNILINPAVIEITAGQWTIT